MKAEALVIMAKFPEPGRVKTRLNIAPEEAAALSTAFILDLVNAHSGQCYDVILAVDPAGAQESARRLFQVEQTLGQAGEHLGERIAGAMRTALTQHGKVAVIGSDLPTLDPTTVRVAFESLERYELVLGPAEDGGFYLVAASREPPIFDDIPWSTPHVFLKTFMRAREARLRTYLLPQFRDIDTWDDLRSMLPLLGKSVPATSREVRRLMERHPQRFGAR